MGPKVQVFALQSDSKPPVTTGRSMMRASENHPEALSDAKRVHLLRILRF